MRPTVPIAMGGPGGPVMEAPKDFAAVYDPIETLTYVAARTSRITLGTSVLDALFQSPVILARRLATLDRFSGGRLIAGIGQVMALRHQFETGRLHLLLHRGFLDPVQLVDLVLLALPQRDLAQRRFTRWPGGLVGHLSGGDRGRHRTLSQIRSQA